jgi:hypothetical protein
MFDTLTQRERRLAIIVASVLPLAAAFFAVTLFFNALGKKNASITRLRKQISENQQLQLEGQWASERRVYYRRLSLPADEKKSRNVYEGWLRELTKKTKMDFVALDDRSAVDVKYNGQRTTSLVFRQHPYTLRVRGSLDQLTEFLYSFYEIDLLHRIQSVSIIPLNQGTSAESRSIRTGKLGLTIEIDVISLVDAETERDGFVENKRPLARTLDEYKQQIVFRNIFGPANNPPTFAGATSRTVQTGSDIAFSISGNDVDKNDQLALEIVDNAIEKAEVVVKNSKTGSFQFTAPPLDEGKYTIRFKLTDNGCPPKSTETDFVLTVKDPPPKVTPVEPPPTPPFLHAGETIIPRISMVNGTPEVVIKIKSLGKRFELKVGDTFELDDKTWTVKAIDFRSVTLEVDGQTRTYQQGDNLGSIKP